jgi:uncharacterized ferredoxin-like protein
MNIAANIYVSCGVANIDIGLVYGYSIYAANIYAINSLISSSIGTISTRISIISSIAV